VNPESKAHPRTTSNRCAPAVWRRLCSYAGRTQRPGRMQSKRCPLMARSRNRVCRIPGCPAIQADSLCDAHKRERDRHQRRTTPTKVTRDWAERQRRASAVVNHKAAHGNWCPGIGVPVPPGGGGWSAQVGVPGGGSESVGLAGVAGPAGDHEFAAGVAASGDRDHMVGGEVITLMRSPRGFAPSPAAARACRVEGQNFRRSLLPAHCWRSV